MIVLVGFSASGKSTIEKILVNKGFVKITSYTTRPLRVKDNEVDGVAYHFISDEDFDKKLNTDCFAENTSYNTVFGVWRYASAKEDIDDNKVCVLNPDGLRQLKEHDDLNIVSFYIEVDEDIIINRLIKRGDKKKEYERRLEADRNDFANIFDEVDYVINGNELTAEELADNILWLLNNGKDMTDEKF